VTPIRLERNISKTT